MFAVYTEISDFENIIFLEDHKYPNWNKVFRKNVDIILNTTDQELDKEIENPDSPISLFLQSSASAKIPIALQPYFDELKENLKMAIDHPQSVFMLDVAKEEVDFIKENYGVAMFASDDLVDDYFTRGYYKEVSKSGKFIDGWKSLLDIPLPISNAMVLSDEYLFSNEERGANLGEENLIGLLDAMLPEFLSVDYHLTVITGNSKKSIEFWTKLAGRINSKINTLRDYPVNFELVISETIHKRRLVTNFLNCWADKGFDLFKNSDKEIIRQENDFHVYEIFHNLNNHGTSHYDSIVNALKQLSDICAQTTDRVKKDGQTLDGMILGACNSDKSVKNRLLN